METQALQGRVVDLLKGNAPAGTKCIFLNCEMHETPGGMTISHDVFAVTKSLLGRPRRVPMPLDAVAATALNELARQQFKENGKDLIVVDLLIHGDGTAEYFMDAEPPRRLGPDGDDFFKTKHKSYAHLERWLAEVD